MTNALNRPARLVLTLLACLALLATACGQAVDATSSDDPTATEADAGDSGDTGDEAPEADAEGDTPVLVSDDPYGVEVSGELGEKPEITLPDTEPPADLIVYDLEVGDGEEVPAGATVTTDYIGVSWTNAGAVFDNSFDRGQPATFPLSGVIPGWTQGIPGMKVGGRRMLIIPPDMAYGPAAPSPDIAANDTLVFVIDMVEVVPPPEPIEPTTDAQGVEVSGEPGEKPEVTIPAEDPPTDLIVVDLVVGDGEEVPFDATVTTHYLGASWTNAGAVFDNSFDRGDPSTFPLSGVISGWTDGIPGMRVGGRRLLIIPPDQAYGPASPNPDIAENDTLVFVIDMVEIAG